MATTLIEASQNSNSPNDFTETIFVMVSDSSNARLTNQVGRVRQPEANQSCTGHRLERNDDDPEIPVHPAGQKPGQLAQRRPVAPGQSGIFVERADRRQGDRHLTEHAHDQHDEQSGDDEGQDGRGSCRFDDHAAADEKTGADDSTESNHRHVPLLQAMAKTSGGLAKATGGVGEVRREFGGGSPEVSEESCTPVHYFNCRSM